MFIRWCIPMGNDDDEPQCFVRISTFQAFAYPAHSHRWTELIATIDPSWTQENITVILCFCWNKKQSTIEIVEEKFPTSFVHHTTSSRFRFRANIDGTHHEFILGAEMRERQWNHQSACDKHRAIRKTKENQRNRSGLVTYDRLHHWPPRLGGGSSCKLRGLAVIIFFSVSVVFGAESIRGNLQQLPRWLHWLYVHPNILEFQPIRQIGYARFDVQEFTDLLIFAQKPHSLK